MHGIGVLELIQIGDAEIVPAHPVRVIPRVWRRGRIVADIQGAATGGEFHHRIRGMVLSQNVIQITLTQVAIVHARRNRQRALYAGGNLKFIAHQSGTSGLDAVVVGDRVDGPDLMIVYKAAIRVDGPVGEAMSPLIERAVGLQEATVIDSLPAASWTTNSTHGSYRSRTSGTREWPMFLFCITTIICTISFGASWKGAEPRGAVMAPSPAFSIPNRSTFKYIPDFRNSIVFCNWSSKP